MNKSFFNIFVLAFVVVFSAPAFASYPDATGTWTGNITDTEVCPPTPGPAGTFTGNSNVTVLISNQVEGNFDVNVTSVSTDDGDTLTYSGSGYFTSTTQVFVEFSGINELGATEDWSGTFNVSPSTLTVVSLSGTEMGGPNCTFTVSAGQTLTRVIGSNVIIAPEVVPGTSVTNNPQTLATSVTTTTGFLNARVQSALSGSQHVGVSRAGQGFMAEASGLSAGDTFNNLGMWASYAYTDFENDFSRTKYDGDTDTFFVGIDFTPSDNAVLGIAIGYEDMNTDTDFNGGKSDADGYTFAPYFGMTINETWSFDLMGGYSSIDTDQYRLGLVGGAPVGARITSDVDTDRLFFAGNFNGFTQIDRWNLSGRIGAMYASSTDEDFTESNGTVVLENNSKLSQFTLGGEAAYAFDEFEPFVSAAYNYDMTKTETQFLTGKQPSSDDDDFLLGLGFRYFGKSGLSVSAQYDARVGRSDYDEDTISVNARWDF